MLGLHNVSAHNTVFNIKTHTHTLQIISDNLILLPPQQHTYNHHLSMFYAPLVFLSQILQYLCVQQYFNKEYEN